MPFIEGGGVEKNLFLISNFLIKKIRKITIITISKNIKKNLINQLNLSLCLLTYGVNLEKNFNIF